MVAPLLMRATTTVAKPVVNGLFRNLSGLVDGQVSDLARSLQSMAAIAGKRNPAMAEFLNPAAAQQAATPKVQGPAPGR